MTAGPACMRSPSPWCALLLFGSGVLACRADGGAHADDGGSTGGPTSSDDGSDGSTGADTIDPDSSGGAPSGPVACDPRADECAPQVCSGSALGGFLCRPPCSSMAMEGTPCSEGVCLPATPGADALACFGLVACDPITDEGCPGGESCVVVDANPLGTTCVPAGTAMPGDPCGPAGGAACASGSACIGADLADDVPGTCMPWCDPNGALPADCASCVAIADALGICAECDVLGDTCPAGSHCEPHDELLGGACGPDGPGLPGSPCDPGAAATACTAGLVCVELLPDAFTCVERCDPAMPACTDPAAQCLDVALVEDTAPAGQLGVCVAAGAIVCDAAMAPAGCADGEVCLVVAPDVGVCGADCDPTAGDTACTGNAACLPEADGMIDVAPFVAGNGACGTECADDLDCGAGTCVLLDGLDVPGLCDATGTACDPALPTPCVEPEATSCVALAGATTGICLAQCFVQDPSGCGDPTACHGKTDAAWHSGVCIGQRPACDPIAQDCIGPQTCTVVGGTAIGGHAFVCGGAGAVASGGDCTGDAASCAPGLLCIADVCRMPCDPAADDCAAGSCVDVGAGFSLPSGTLGVCM